MVIKKLRQPDILLISFLFLFLASCERATETPPPTATIVPVTETPTQTPTPMLPIDALTPVPLQSPTQNPGADSKFTPILDAKGIPMLPVPEGDFMMGGTTPSDVEPAQKVTLSAFYMDEFEVTNAFYKACVLAGACSPPAQIITDYYVNPQYDRYPVIFVDWNMAETYCEWRGARLPTEAQWEKAARGADGRTYPWGEVIDCSFANYHASEGDKFCGDKTSQVGSYESGRSIYGLYDMAGNVWEWVADWYGPYTSPVPANPTGPKDGSLRVMRGGSYDAIPFNATTTFRTKAFPNYSANDTGFRCAKSAKP